MEYTILNSKDDKMNNSSPPSSPSPQGTLHNPDCEVPTLPDDTALTSDSTTACVIDPLAVHGIEREVMNRLQNHPKLKFTRLDVHRCNQDAVCIEGFLESNEDEIDLCEVVRGIHGIKNVVNRVVTAHPTQPSCKKG